MRTRLVALALAMTLPMPVLAGDVVVRSGETLSEIAERVGVSVERLMAVNGLSDPNHIEAGQKLRLPGGASPSSRGGGAASGTSVTVKEGETLSEIADRHGLSVNKLMALNGITDPDQLQVGQRLKLGGSATTAASGARPAAAAPAAPVYRKGAREHVVRSGESLSQIADGYGLPQSRLVALNGITDPDELQVGQRLRLQGTPPVSRPQARATPAPAAAAPAAAARPASATPATPTAARTTPAAAAPAPRPAAAAATPATTAAPIASATATPARTTAPATTTTATNTAAGAARPDWRSYGPLQVDWANWLPMGGSLVAPTLNSEGQSLYLAINCSARKLNATSQAGEWKTWDDPQAEFERQLVSDLCKSRG